MAKLTTGDVAKMYGLSRTTVWKAAKAGKLSYDLEKQRGRDVMVFDASEIQRVYGEPQPSEPFTEQERERMATSVNNEKANLINHLNDQIQLLQEALNRDREQLQDSRVDRDKWREVALQNQKLLSDQRDNDARKSKRGFFAWVTGAV